MSSSTPWSDPASDPLADVLAAIKKLQQQSVSYADERIEHWANLQPQAVQRAREVLGEEGLATLRRQIAQEIKTRGHLTETSDNGIYNDYAGPACLVVNKTLPQTAQRMGVARQTLVMLLAYALADALGLGERPTAQEMVKANDTLGTDVVLKALVPEED